jgi:phage shock protein C
MKNLNTFLRSSSDRYISGVCGGLGRYTSIDPIIWRILFIFVPNAIWIYLIIMILTKDDKE